MSTERDYSVNLSVQQVLSLWVHGTTLQHFTGMRSARRRYSLHAFMYAAVLATAACTCVVCSLLK